MGRRSLRRAPRRYDEQHLLGIPGRFTYPTSPPLLAAGYLGPRYRPCGSAARDTCNGVRHTGAVTTVNRVMGDQAAEHADELVTEAVTEAPQTPTQAAPGERKQLAIPQPPEFSSFAEERHHRKVRLAA